MCSQIPTILDFTPRILQPKSLFTVSQGLWSQGTAVEKGPGFLKLTGNASQINSEIPLRIRIERNRFVRFLMTVKNLNCEPLKLFLKPLNFGDDLKRHCHSQKAGKFNGKWRGFHSQSRGACAVAAETEASGRPCRANESHLVNVPVADRWLLCDFIHVGEVIWLSGIGCRIGAFR